MVQIFETNDPRNRLSEMLGLSLGQGIGTGLNTYFANKSLENVMQDEKLNNASQSEKLEALRAALSPYGDTGKEIFQQRMLIDKQKREEDELNKIEAEKEILGRFISGEKVSDKDLGKISPQNQLKLQEFQKRKESGRSVFDSLIRAGYPEETAKIWQMQMENAPTGGQSDVIRNVNDLIRRSKSGKGMDNETQLQAQIKPNIDIPGTTIGTLKLDFPELPQPLGMTPSDIVKQNEYREKTISPLYEDTVNRLNALDDEYREVQHLQELNQIPDALPTGIQKWNVDWDTGDLRVKALATPEAQDYVKTIARMARRAKDFFPGRVTNFDLSQFKQGFPTLANSPEGRKIIAEQLALGNRIAYLKDETYKAAVEHYGSGADPILIKKYATENFRRLKTQLEDQLKQVNLKARSMTEEQTDSENRPSLDEIFK